MGNKFSSFLNNLFGTEQSYRGTLRHESFRKPKYKLSSRDYISTDNLFPSLKEDYFPGEESPKHPERTIRLENLKQYQDRDSSVFLNNEFTARTYRDFPRKLYKIIKGLYLSNPPSFEEVKENIESALAINHEEIVYLYEDIKILQDTIKVYPDRMIEVSPDLVKKSHQLREILNIEWRMPRSSGRQPFESTYEFKKKRKKTKKVKKNTKKLAPRGATVKIK